MSGFHILQSAVRRAWKEAAKDDVLTPPCSSADAPAASSTSMFIGMQSKSASRPPCASCVWLRIESENYVFCQRVEARDTYRVQALHDAHEAVLDLVLAQQQLEDHAVLLLRRAAARAGRLRQALDHAVPEEHAPVHRQHLVVLPRVHREAEALDHALARGQNVCFQHNTCRQRTCSDMQWLCMTVTRAEGLLSTSEA